MQVVIETTASGMPLKIVLNSLNIAQCDMFAAQAKAILLARCEKIMQTNPKLRDVVAVVLENIVISDCVIPSQTAVDFLQTIPGLIIALRLMSSPEHQIQMSDDYCYKILEEKFVEVQKAVIQLCPFLNKAGQTSGTTKPGVNASESSSEKKTIT